MQRALQDVEASVYYALIKAAGATSFQPHRELPAMSAATATPDPAALVRHPSGRPLRVTMVGSSDRNGGANRAMLQLHEELLAMGVESRLVVQYQTTNGAGISSFTPPTGLLSRLRQRLRRRTLTRALDRCKLYVTDGFDLLSDDRTDNVCDWLQVLPPHDVLHLHFFSGFLDAPSFFAQWPVGRPLAWTLHDMNAFTGVCHYTNGCEKFTSHCGDCPQVAWGVEKDLAYEVFARKVQQIGRLDPRHTAIAADSHWLAREAVRSRLFNRFPVVPVHYGLDTTAFVPRDKMACRAALGLPLDQPIVMFIAWHARGKRKGFVVLAQALQQLRQRLPVHLMAVGANRPPQLAGVPCDFLGFVGDPRLLSTVYSAADVLVVPSLQEAFGLTALEACACGTPVVAFEAGGLVDIVRHNETGRLAKVGDAADLEHQIEWLLAHPEERARMGQRGREVAVTEFSPRRQAVRYLELYQQALAGTVGQGTGTATP